ncbi:MAG: Lrp/AsnC family transcriptional regulator [Pseudomonadota bacterium]
MHDLDTFDRLILRELQQDADISMQDLGERVGLSHTPCWRRVKKLEEAGVIRRRVTLLEPDHLDLSVNVFVQVSLAVQDEDALNRFESAVQSIPEIVECYTVSGDRDFLLRVVVEDVSAYERLLKSTLVHLPEVANMSSTFALRQVKYTTELPLG